MDLQINTQASFYHCHLNKRKLNNYTLTLEIKINKLIPSYCRVSNFTFRFQCIFVARFFLQVLSFFFLSYYYFCCWTISHSHGRSQAQATRQLPKAWRIFLARMY